MTAAVTSISRQYRSPSGRGVPGGSVSPPGMTGGAHWLGTIHGCKRTLTSGRAIVSWTSRAANSIGTAASTTSGSSASWASSRYCRPIMPAPHRAATQDPFNGSQKSGLPNSARVSSAVTSG